MPLEPNKKLRLLVANIPLPSNRFLVDLNAALAQHCELVQSSDTFWQMTGEFDVVHLHFPEYLTYEIESAYKLGLSEQLLREVEKRLIHWSTRAIIVVTRHVLLPHDAREDPIWERMYEIVYRYADGVVHLGDPSVDEFKHRYSACRFKRGKQPLHTVVPHHNYASLPNTITKVQARRKLRIKPDASVLLVFGSIRGDDERRLVLETFDGLRQPDKVLLVSRWREHIPNVSWIRLKYWLRDAIRYYYRIHPRFHFNYGFVEEGDTQTYLNAADVLFIPRLHVLNSGNVALGMTFGRVVVGPDSWDVGATLRDTGNPVFDPDNPSTAPQAVAKGFSLAKEGQLGESNRRIALSQWRVDRCADEYVAFFRTVMADEYGTPNQHRSS